LIFIFFPIILGHYFKELEQYIKIYAEIVKTLHQETAKWYLIAIVNLMSNPVNSTATVVAKILKKASTYDPKW